MTTIELARKLAGLNQKEEAQKAYILYLNQETEEKKPEEEMEAASYIFFSQGDYLISYTIFVSLYNKGYFKDEIMNIMLQAFYLPNVDKQKKQYEKNCKELLKYPYFFRENFPKFEELKILFFPFDDKGFIPFYIDKQQFGDYINFNYEVVDRYFFKDLEKPILADDVYSQYQLEYLNDNVRKSEWVAKENHIYLHYQDFNQFCSYLTCLDFYYILKEKKIVFLIEDEISRYPIDFKKEFGIDYSQFSVKPIGIREINKIIWHTQLSTHNGGDFFNEVLYNHPNLITSESIMLDNVEETIEDFKKLYVKKKYSGKVLTMLRALKNPTDKDFLIAMFIESEDVSSNCDPSQRITPALTFQPHFGNITYKFDVKLDKNMSTILYSPEYEKIRNFNVFKEFKYIKTFTPMRRITTSYAASIRFWMNRPDLEEGNKEGAAANDPIAIRILNRSFMVNTNDRLYRDSRLVRFEDGKLNPKATFTALAKFLDIPYTESMTYCSGIKGINQQSFKGNAIGFDTSTVYRTYDEYANNSEREYIEYFMRDAYDYYGYNFNYYNGEDVNEEWVENKIKNFDCIDGYVREQWTRFLKNKTNKEVLIDNNIVSEENITEGINKFLDTILKSMYENRIKLSKCLLNGLYFINKNGQPLRMMTPLKLDPELLEQPLYH